MSPFGTSSYPRSTSPTSKSLPTSLFLQVLVLERAYLQPSGLTNFSIIVALHLFVATTNHDH